jgi:nitrate/nitrite-specific signal transduction histidine kinase
MKKPAVLRAYLLGREYTSMDSSTMRVLYSDMDSLEQMAELQTLHERAERLYRCKEFISSHGSRTVRASHFLDRLSHPTGFPFPNCMTEPLTPHEWY